MRNQEVNNPQSVVPSLSTRRPIATLHKFCGGFLDLALKRNLENKIEE
jgi:hypothetical protein